MVRCWSLRIKVKSLWFPRSGKHLLAKALTQQVNTALTDIKPRLVLDTNVILDLLVFQDPAAEVVWIALDAKLVDAVRTEESMHPKS